MSIDSFAGVYQVFLERGWGHVGLLLSEASDWPLEIWLAVQMFKKLLWAYLLPCSSLCDSS